MRRQVDTEQARRAEAEAELEQHKAEIARLSAELGATKNAVAGLPATPSATEDIQCPICFCAMIDPTTLVCGHSGCLGCMDTALATSQRKCPVCRAIQPGDATLWTRKERNTMCVVGYASGSRACSI